MLGLFAITAPLMAMEDSSSDDDKWGDYANSWYDQRGKNGLIPLEKVTNFGERFCNFGDETSLTDGFRLKPGQNFSCEKYLPDVDVYSIKKKDQLAKLLNNIANDRNKGKVKREHFPWDIAYNLLRHLPKDAFAKIPNEGWSHEPSQALRDLSNGLQSKGFTTENILKIVHNLGYTGAKTTMFQPEKLTF